jgi:hypothetical protein
MNAAVKSLSLIDSVNSGMRNKIVGILAVIFTLRCDRPLALIFIGLLIMSCSGSADIKLSDLRFEDYERDAIREKGITRTLVMYHFLENSQTDTIYYDSLGRKCYEATTVSSVRTSYDTNGLVIAKTFNERSSHPVTDSASYTFVKDSLILYQSWSYDSHSYRFLFNREGKVMEKLTYNKGNLAEKKSLVKFFYNGGLLTKMEYFRYSLGRNKLFVTSTIYYSGENIDSLVQHSPVQKKLVTVYDNNGLAEANFYDGGLFRSYIHEKR